jgi:hypothetical protein
MPVEIFFGRQDLPLALSLPASPVTTADAGQQALFVARRQP